MFYRGLGRGIPSVQCAVAGEQEAAQPLQVALRLPRFSLHSYESTLLSAQSHVVRQGVGSKWSLKR
jgi:hypothetical protein